ncbi:transporter [Coemansia sp. BCRC 34301]|nr:transporter [Coemansia sp. BCRC 34301]
MPHMNDLPSVILTRILYHVAATPAKTLFWWKNKLPLLAVCRAWTKLAQPFVLNHIYVQAFGICAKSESSTSAPSFDTCIGWTSNAELLISRYCVLMARRLTIEIVSGTTLNHLSHIALDILKLDRVDWMNINTLTIADKLKVCDHVNKQPVVDDSITAGVARTMEYFGQNMRNVVELNLTMSFSGATRDLIRNGLATLYNWQLQILRSPILTPACFPQFSRSLAVLELKLNSEATRVLPGVCGETLRVLRLANAPRNFAWHHFRYDIFARPIVFPRLVLLHLLYRQEATKPTEDEVQDKVASGTFNCDQLHFPVLKQLHIRNCTPDCDLLYVDTPFPELEKVDLSGAITSLCHCKRLKLGWVGSLKVGVDSRWNSLTTDIHDVTNYFFSSICIGRSATLAIYSNDITIDPELVRWNNLTNLWMVSASYKAFCKLVARLPSLTKFQIQRLELGPVLADGLPVDESLFCCTDPLLAWGERLATVKINEFDKHCSVKASAYGVQAIVFHATALRELLVPSSIHPLLASFIDENKDRFPRLADIRLAGCQAITSAFGGLGPLATAFVYRDRDSPEFVLGHSVCLSMTVLCLAATGALRWMLALENDRRDRVPQDISGMATEQILDMADNHPDFWYTL